MKNIKPTQLRPDTCQISEWNIHVAGSLEALNKPSIRFVKVSSKKYKYWQNDPATLVVEVHFRDIQDAIEWVSVWAALPDEFSVLKVSYTDSSLAYVFRMWWD